MTLKLALSCDDPPPQKKNIHKIFIPPKIFIFLKTPKNIEIQNFEPKKIARAYVCVKISEYPPPPPGRNPALCKCDNKGLTSIWAKICAYTWVSENLGHSNAKNKKNSGNSYTFLFFFLKKKGGGVSYIWRRWKGGGGYSARTSVLCHI